MLQARVDLKADLAALGGPLDSIFIAFAHCEVLNPSLGRRIDLYVI